MTNEMNGPRRSGRKVAAAIAGAAALALLVSGCTAGTGDAESDRQSGAFSEVYAQTINWGECGDDYGLSAPLVDKLLSLGVPADTFTCAMVSAPMDWNDPDNEETIELATLHIPSTGSGAPLGTLLSNPGGPGSSGIGLAYSLPADPNFAEILENYDILGFDPRGIERSTPVNCMADSSIQELVIAECAASSPLAATMGTSQVARDMDMLRALMGDDKLNYLGYSYGTMLGATYATLFPERVGRMVLDSAAASDWASPIGGFNQSAAISRETIALLEGCDSLYGVTDCPISDEQTLLAVTAILQEEPLIATDGTEVNGTMVYGYLTTALYQRPAGRAFILENIGGALGGELGSDQAMIDAIAEAMAGGGAQVSVDGTIVRCHSFPVDPKLPELVAHIEEVGLPVLLGGPELNDDTLRPWVDLACDALPNSGDDVTDSFSGSPDAPILVIGITGDHATPYEGSERLVEELGNATLLTLEGTGHGASYAKRSSCIDEHTTAYLLKGTMPPAGTVCQDD